MRFVEYQCAGEAEQLTSLSSSWSTFPKAELLNPADWGKSIKDYGPPRSFLVPITSTRADNIPFHIHFQFSHITISLRKLWRSNRRRISPKQRNRKSPCPPTSTTDQRAAKLYYTVCHEQTCGLITINLYNSRTLSPSTCHNYCGRCSEPWLTRLFAATQFGFPLGQKRHVAGS